MNKRTEQSMTSTQSSEYSKLESKYFQNLNELTALKQENNKLRFQINDFNQKLKENDGDLRIFQEKMKKKKKKNNLNETKIKLELSAPMLYKELAKTTQKKRMTRDIIKSRNRSAVQSREKKDTKDKVYDTYEEPKKYKIKLSTSQKAANILKEAIKIEEQGKNEICMLKDKVEELEKRQDSLSEKDKLLREIKELKGKIGEMERREERMKRKFKEEIALYKDEGSKENELKKKIEEIKKEKDKEKELVEEENKI